MQNTNKNIDTNTKSSCPYFTPILNSRDVVGGKLRYKQTLLWQIEKKVPFFRWGFTSKTLAIGWLKHIWHTLIWRQLQTEIFWVKGCWITRQVQQGGLEFKTTILKSFSTRTVALLWDQYQNPHDYYQNPFYQNPHIHYEILKIAIKKLIIIKKLW